MIYVYARMEINPGCMDKMKALLARTVPKVLAEDGCVQYIPCVDCDEPEKYITFVEAWENREKHKAHLAAPHMAFFREAANPLRRPSTVHVITPAERS